MSIQQYREKILELSNQIVEAQKPILILDSIKWPYQVQQDFLAGGGKNLPAIDTNFYNNYQFGFDPSSKREELVNLLASIKRKLGEHDSLGKILQRTVEQYIIVIDLLVQRGRKAFQKLSQELYGSANDHLRGDSKTLVQLGEKLCYIFSLPATQHLTRPYPKNVPATDAVNRLDQKLHSYFFNDGINVILSDGIVSDASAGGDTIKINSNAVFSELDLQVLEVHEGWVHIGTTLNGRNQQWATWLSVGSPRITATQEGLAVLIETLTFSSNPDRARRISDRVVAIHMAEQGADFIEVFRHFVDRSLSENESYKIAQRVFRGGMVEGGSCFTKDLSYVRGFVETINFIRSAILSDVPELLSMLFLGKLTLDDIPVLYQHVLEGTISPPQYLPPMFSDVNGLYTWFGFSSGIMSVDLALVQKHFESLFQEISRSSPVKL